MPLLNQTTVRKVFKDHGFTVKEGQTDLKQYVYEAAAALEDSCYAALEPSINRYVQSITGGAIKPLFMFDVKTIDDLRKHLVSQANVSSAQIEKADLAEEQESEIAYLSCINATISLINDYESKTYVSLDPMFKWWLDKNFKE